MLSINDAQQLLRFAQRLAAAAAEVTVAAFRQPVAISGKSDYSPLTAADRRAEEVMRALIEKHHPTHGIVGEEFGNQTANAEFVWVLDPIDGTRSFISGSPQYATLIALLQHGKAVIGVLDFPALKEQYCGIDIHGHREARFNNQICRCSAAAPPLPQAVIAATTVAVSAHENDRRLQKMIRQCPYTRLGGDAFSYACVAAGFCHLALDYDMQPYDYLPLVPLITGGGGIISDWQGQPLTLPKNTDADTNAMATVVAAATTALHREALAMLATG